MSETRINCACLTHLAKFIVCVSHSSERRLATICVVRVSLIRDILRIDYICCDYICCDYICCACLTHLAKDIEQHNTHTINSRTIIYVYMLRMSHSSSEVYCVRVSVYTYVLCYRLRFYGDKTLIRRYIYTVHISFTHMFI